jgi:hypothetical protein
MHACLKLIGLAVGLSAAAAASAGEETLLLFQDRRVVIKVPEKYVYTSARDDQGLITVKIVDPKQKTELQVSFFPDPRQRLATEDGRRAFVADLCMRYAESSVEKGYDFKELKPRTGSGLYCVFTDASLAHKLPAPPGEYLNVSCGIKVWSGSFLVFTLLSNTTTSVEYETQLKLLQETFEEKGPAI